MTITIDPAMRRRVVWSSTIGNALEWFDFTVFGLFAGTIGKQFFPKSDPAAGMLAAYGLLGIAYLARPVGGLVFGIWADKVGRKRALITIVLAMGLGTAVIGLIPTYATIGVWAPILLLCARLVQGFSAGGEFGTSTAMLVEFAPPDRKGFYASFQFVAQNLAFVIGAAFAYVLNSTLAPESMDAWGWRVPFLFGIVIAPIGFYLRSAVDETPEFKAFLASRAGLPNTPLKEVLRRFPLPLISLFLMIAGLTAFVYIGNIFLTNFAETNLKLKLADAQLGILIVNLISAAILPLAGLLSDRIGRKAVLAPGVVIFGVVYLTFASFLVAQPTTAALWTMQSAGLLFIFVNGPYAALAVETFPVHVRSTGASIVYNFGVAIFGGLSPFITGSLVRATASNMAPFYYLAGCLILSLIGLAILPKASSRGA
jgi:MHS family proline/betaine transporter-like MFS transporter